MSGQPAPSTCWGDKGRGITGQCARTGALLGEEGAECSGAWRHRNFGKAAAWNCSDRYVPLALRGWPTSGQLAQREDALSQRKCQVFPWLRWHRGWFEGQPTVFLLPPARGLLLRTGHQTYGLVAVKRELASALMQAPEIGPGPHQHAGSSKAARASPPAPSLAAHGCGRDSLPTQCAGHADLFSYTS